jgi:uncharacterized integral membrane protein
MRIFSWLLRAFIFFTLFAFALNNQHSASVHWFFGVEWRAPMVFVVLAAFAAGCALGAAAMLPGWWKNRAGAAPVAPGAGADAAPGGLPPAAASGSMAKTDGRPGSAPSDFGADHPSRLGV